MHAGGAIFITVYGTADVFPAVLPGQNKRLRRCGAERNPLRRGGRGGAWQCLFRKGESRYTERVFQSKKKTGFRSVR